MKKTLILVLGLVFANLSFAQSTISISGSSTVEVGVPYNYAFDFNPQYPWNASGTVQADSYIITEWIVSTDTNGQSASIIGYINTPSNQSSYYYDGTYNNSNPKTIPIQWGDGTFLSSDNITVKVSGLYRKNSTGENIGYFNYQPQAIKSITVQRLVAPIIQGNTNVASCSQANQTYTFTNDTNSTNRLWSVDGGATIVGSATGTSVTVTPPFVGNFNVSCTVKRSGSNSSYSVSGSKSISRTPFTGSAIISGASAFCASSSYYLANVSANQTISWSLSNPTFASLSSTTNSTIDITGIKQGDVTLTARITNVCGEFYDVTKVITIGVNNILPELTTPSGFPYSYPYYNVPESCTDPVYVFITTSPNTNSNSTTKVMRFTYNGISIVKQPVANYYFFLYTSDFNIEEGTIFNVKAEYGNDCGFASTSRNFKLYRPTLCECGVGNGCLQLAKMANPKLKNSTIEKINEIKIYPNPANDVINIDFGITNLSNPRSTNISIYNMLGIQVDSFNINESKTTLDVKKYAKGVYIIKITNDELEENHQFIIK